MSATSPAAAAAAQSLQITEIYLSVQGESTWAGLPCTFVRLTGCPLRCVWCDTSYAFTGGTRMTIAEILERVRELGCPVVEITGGEPLAQPNCSRLMEELIAAGFTVLLETSGAFPISPVPRAVHKIMDLKCPGSGEMHRNLYENLAVLAAHDEVKFVLADRTDYEWARDMTRRHVLGQRVRAVLFSCVFGQIEPALLVEWVTQDRLFEARVQLQAHKYIWSPETRSV